MAARGRVEPCGRVAEALAYILAPPPRLQAPVARPKRHLDVFGGPAQLAGLARADFAPQQPLERPPLRISQTDPREVKQLMRQDARQLRRAAFQRRVEHDPARA